ncbi:hypothetical protein M8J77_016408 [Diaphorina citri]|nr:hypothetical protein M8J77_016408 [Diaphorina citri]
MIQKEYQPDIFDTGSPIITSNIPCATSNVAPSTSRDANTANFNTPISRIADHLITPDTDNDSDTINTVHTSRENPIIGIPISESAVNIGQNQLIITSCSGSEYQKDIQNNLHKDKEV